MSSVRSSIGNQLRPVFRSKNRRKIIILGLAVVLVAILAVIFIVNNDDNKQEKQPQNPDNGQSINSYDDCVKAGYPVQETYPEKCTVPGGKTFTRELTDEEKKNQPGTQSNNPPTTPSPNNTTFEVSKVYFSKVPSVSPHREFGTCQAGEKLTISASADLTATNSGTAKYYWGMGNHLDNSKNENFPEETVYFSSAGTKTIQKQFTYTVVPTGDSTPENPYYWNRLYFNVFVNSPNTTYANINDPLYGAGNFIWGTYVDFC